MPVPVICIGNVLVGGTGKTPLVIALAGLLQQQGRNPHIISRGYGGYLRGPVRVDAQKHTIGEVGDEPLLLAQHAPVWVAKDKAAGARAAIAAGADTLLLDDGLQNGSIAKSLSLLVIDAARGLGNGLVLPAGPLREPLEDALAKSHAVLWVGAGNAALRASLAAQKPVLDVSAETHCLTHHLAGRKLYAFCGLGHAQKFYAGLASLGGTVMETRDFPDHHLYSVFELQQVLEKARALGALPVTTAKDAVRIPKSLLAECAVCDVAIRFADLPQMEKLLLK